MLRRSALFTLAAPFGLCIPPLARASTPADAGDWPSKPIRVVVPFPAGGAGDLVPRILGERLSKLWRQPIVVENKAGADGIIGMDFVAKAAADGYTVGVASSGPVVIGKRLFPNLPFEPATDLLPVSLTYETPFVLIVPGNSPLHRIDELIAAAKASPGRLNVAIPNRGSIQHLLTEQMKGDTQTDMPGIPYKGGGPAALAVASGEVDLSWGALPNVVGLVRAGRVRAIAVSSAQRAGLLPDVATVGEQGHAGWTCTNWNGLVVPRNTPAPVIARMNARIADILQEPEVRQRFQDMGISPLGGTPQRFAQLLREEEARWGRVIAQRGIRPE
ncbi:MAG TPA: tripartite tricarboxylate transporter substrate binding protein [Pseudorhodoferax sp.]|jgi:tripartite-type tricarboxylate transporter receptor subunit TctC|nr:tripartite tricarboxylate transporter substrate binding protein [Pseudorhodoferax sp.]